MTDKTWRITSIILLIIMSLFLLYFIIKGYIDYKYITLTKVHYGKPGTLNHLLKKINTARKFKNISIKRDELTYILWAGYGKTRNNLRTVVSFSEFPLHIYICINNKDVNRLDAGLYEYLPDIHNLKRIKSNGYKEKLLKVFKTKGHNPCILIITVSKEHKENKKAYFELGEMTANITLKARELKLKMKLIPEFETEKVMKILKLDKETPIMIILIGK